ncbi:WD40 repeat-like protein [Daedalea quercina L-15889]|uniref:WD40 repeat-like protein n=1 Tax=Daedalea quercina L-15889 TaxID=1314783 RepID=A0A165U4L3_9APHY|nr:WD40 repeat-like protein [Daedalea quercina L-15889]
MTQHIVDLTLSPWTSLPSFTSSGRRNRRLLSSAMLQPLDRVDVLGDDHHGHTGCVNALSWAKNGELLISGGDDTTVRVWRMDSNDSSRDYPFKCETVIYTGHRGNVFNAHMLPHSTRIATVAADRQLRISDVEAAVHSPRYNGETEYTSSQANVKVLRCHSGRVKRIVTEESPDMFLTVAEDGTVRQHDLRVPHSCASGNCPSPLVRLHHELSTIALSSLTPYQFVVAGEAPYGYLFDRRHAGRVLKEEWGIPPDSDSVTTCVRRFGRVTRGPSESRGYEHITGARMASTNGHEVLLSYSSDAVYLYSTHDDPAPESLGSRSTILPSNPSHRQSTRSSPVGNEPATIHQTDAEMEDDIERMTKEDSAMGHEYGSQDAHMDEDTDDDDDDDDAEDDDEDMNNIDSGVQDIPAASTSNVPIVYPRARFVGACNAETVKDVNFLGPQDEYVVSGSDDGNFFIWRKATSKLHDILEGDGSVVNVIEGHPHLPLVAVSGIDTTVKLFGPAHGPTQFSRLRNAENIVKRNSEDRSRRIDLSSLFLHYQLARSALEAGEGPGADCPVQ